MACIVEGSKYKPGFLFVFHSVFCSDVQPLMKETQSVITVLSKHTVHQLCLCLAVFNTSRLWVVLPGSRGVGMLPCLHTNWQQRRHRGSKDLWWSVEQKGERKSSRGKAFILSLCISLFVSIALVVMMHSDQQHRIHWIIDWSPELNCSLYKGGFVFIGLSKLHIKRAHLDHSVTQSARRPCPVLHTYRLRVCVASGVSMCSRVWCGILAPV